MSEKNRFKNTIRKVGAFFLLSSAPLTSSAQGMQPADNSPQNQKQVADAAPTVNNNIKKLQQELSKTKFTKYKGLNIDLDSIQPQEIAHVFESGCNPCITDNFKPIRTAKYIGLCQMDINTVIPRFIEEKCKNSTHFSSLYTFKKNKKIRTAAFMNEWRKLSYGPYAAEFEHAQFSFMFEIVYQNIFDKLHKTGYFPEINIENCANPENFIYSAAVMSCVNQNPKRTDEIFLRTFNDMCKAELQKHKIPFANHFNPKAEYKTKMPVLKQDLAKNIALLEKNGLEIDDSYTKIALETYSTKDIVFGKMGGRYKQERKLLEEKLLRIKKMNTLQNLLTSPVMAQTIGDKNIDFATTSFAFHPEIEKEINILREIENARNLISSNKKTDSEEIVYQNQNNQSPKRHNIALGQKQVTLADLRRQKIKNSRQKA